MVSFISKNKEGWFGALQLALLAMRKAGREQGRIDQFIKDAVRHVPRLQEAILGMADRDHFLDAHVSRLWEDDD